MSYIYKKLNNKNIEELQCKKITFYIKTKAEGYKYNSIGFCMVTNGYTQIHLSLPADLEIEYRFSKSSNYETIKNKKIRFISVYINSLNRFIILKIRSKEPIYHNLDLCILDR